MYQIKYYVVCLLLLSTSASHAVSLQNGDILHSHQWQVLKYLDLVRVVKQQIEQI